MADIITTLSSRTGIDDGMIRKGLGALLTFLQKNLPADVFSSIQSTLPGASEMLSAFESEPEAEGSSSGFMGMVTSLAAKLFGGGENGGAHLLANLSRIGLSASQIEAFLPQALDALKTYLPPELLERIKGVLPTLATPAGTTGH